MTTNKHSTVTLHKLVHKTLCLLPKAEELLLILTEIEKLLPKTNSETQHLLIISKELCSDLSNASTIIGVLSALLCKHEVLSADTMAELSGESPETILSVADLFEGPEEINLDSLK